MYMEKTLINLLLRNQKADDLESIECSSTTVCWNDDPDLFYGKAKFDPLYFCMGKKGKTMDFSETVVVYDIKVGRCG